MAAIKALLKAAASASPSKVALAVPHQSISWTFAELYERVSHLSDHLAGGGSAYLLEHGYNRWNDNGGGRAPRCVMRLDNVAENVLLQLACASAGVSCCTVKTPDALADEMGAMTTLHAAAATDDLASAGFFVKPQDEGEMRGANVLLHVPSEHARRLLTLAPAAEEFSSASSTDAISRSSRSSSSESSSESSGNGLDSISGGGGGSGKDGRGELCAFYNSATGTPWSALAASGAAMVEHLAIDGEGRGDVICVPITLCHSFGMGATLAAVQSRATLLLPSPTPSAAHTAAALEAHAATVLLADTHTLKALNAAADDDGGGGGFKPPSSLRGGFVKVGSGEALGAGPPVDWSGVPLTTVGKMPAKK